MTAPVALQSTTLHPVRVFDSMFDMVAHVNRYHSVIGDSRVVVAEGDRFYGTETFEQAEALLRDGWEAGVDGITGDIASALPEVAQRVSSRWDLAGGSVSVPRALSGDPRCMRRVVFAAAKPIVYIAVTGAFLGHHDVDVMLANGRVMVALVDLLTTKGYSCHIDMVGTSRPQTPNGGMEAFSVVTTIKSAGQALDLGSMAFAIANPSTFRRFVFGVRECDRAAVRAGAFGTGQTHFPHPHSGGAARTWYGSPAAAGYDIDLTTEPSASDPVGRVLTALKAWQEG